MLVNNLNKSINIGPIKDLGLVLGYNGKCKKYLPGLRIAFDFPGFTFTNLDITAYIDDSKGVSSGGAPKENDMWYTNLSW